MTQLMNYLFCYIVSKSAPATPALLNSKTYCCSRAPGRVACLTLGREKVGGCFTVTPHPLGGEQARKKVDCPSSGAALPSAEQHKTELNNTEMCPLQL